MKVKTGVYRITNTFNGNVYVGSSASQKGIQGRWNDHKKSLRRGNHSNLHLQRAWNKYGESVFLFEILEVCDPSHCLEREQYYMDCLNPKYNIYPTAGSPLGRIVSDETKRKISESLTGRTLSLDVKQKISSSLTGRPKSTQHIAAVNLALVGKRKSGRDHGRYAGTFAFFNQELKETFRGSQFEFADSHGIDRSAVSKICIGKRKSHHQWVCLGKTHESKKK